MILLIYKIENMKVAIIISLQNLYKTDIWIMNVIGVDLNEEKLIPLSSLI